MSRAPIVVTVSDLRRDTARLIEQANKSHDPLFVTQRGYVTAVLLSRGEFDTMCVLRDRGLRALSTWSPTRRGSTEVDDTESGPRYWGT